MGGSAAFFAGMGGSPALFRRTVAEIAMALPLGAVSRTDENTIPVARAFLG